MSCMVQQSPSKNNPCDIYSDEGFQSLQRQLMGILTHNVLHKYDPTVINVPTHTYTNTHTHGTAFMHIFTSLACSTHEKFPIKPNESTCTTLAHAQLLTYSTATVPLTLPAVKVTMGRKMMPSLASGTFAQTAASTAITAPDW